jgi:hypothetical protein
MSHFFAGPAAFIQPSPPPISNVSDADVVFVHQLQGIQVEFWNVSSTDEVFGSDCKIWGSNYGAIQICIRSSSLNGSHFLISGITR